jgi:hypothetical protein
MDDGRLTKSGNRKSTIGNRQLLHSSLPLSALLRRHGKERAELLLDFLALAFGTSDPLLIVFGHG